MQNYSVKINDKLFLTRLAVSNAKAPTKAVERPVSHLLILDCSGSMASVLPLMREQLKKKLPKLLAEKDIISIIWFSGKDEFGVLLEAEPVATLKDLNTVYAAIDRWLKPICLTGFLQPINEAFALVDKIAKTHPNHVSSLFFLSDGYDNVSSRPEILKALELNAGKFASSTFVEFGYYADRHLLTQMAEKSGGSLIFSEDFDRYEPSFEAFLSKKVSGAPRVELTLHDSPVNGFAFAIHDGQLVTFSVDDEKVLVPEDFECVWYLSKKPSKEIKDLSDVCASIKHADGVFHLNDLEKYPEVQASYAAKSLYAQRMNSDVVYALLRATGDVKLINLFSKAFGKQLISDFCELTANIAKTKGAPGIYQEGRDTNKVPKDDAFTVLDLLHILADDEGNKILFEHESFKYSRIGRGRIDSSDLLTDEERQEIADLTEKINRTKVASQIKVHQARINEILDSKKEALKFVADPAPDGYSIDGVVTNEERPNISIRVQKPGTVDLSSRLPKEIDVPAQFKTHIFRNYAIIADGLVNIENLPCKITTSTLKKLSKSDIPEESCSVEYADNHSAIVVFNLRQLPVVNRLMVKAVSARSLFEQEFKLTQLRAAQKVYNTYVKEKLPTRGFVGIAGIYGDAAAAWLKEQGITDNGFNPKVVQAESKDFYMGKELKVKIKGYSTIPSVKELVAMIAKSKVNPPGALMKPTYDEVETFLVSDTLKVAKDKEGVMKVWFEGQAKETTKSVRELLFLKSKQIFSIIVGQTWPVEFNSLDENTLSVTVDGNKIDGTLDLREVKIQI